MVTLSPKAKEFLRLWVEMSPYASSCIRVVNIEADCRIFFVLDGFDGNVGSYEYHLHPDNLSGFETLEDGVSYSIKDLIK